ncbi:MAG: hypothetical protein JNL21_10690 [Myxococcales bacterium]|nr:hypothetical protein [Myxococcales bacterium]
MRRHAQVVVALLALSLVAAAPRKKKADSPARLAAGKRATELQDRLVGTKLTGFVVTGRRASSSEAAARALTEPPASAVAVDTSSLRGGARGSTWRVVADRADLVQVESVPSSAPGHCSSGAAADPVEVRAFVRKVDLIPLLSEELTETYRDGTSITFAPGALVGAPILPKRGGWAVSAEGIVREMKVAPKQLALSYRAPKPFSFSRKRNDWGRSMSPSTLDGAWAPPSYREVRRSSVLYLDGAAVLRGSSLSSDLHEVQASTAAPEGAPHAELLELASSCVRLKVLGESAAGDNRSGGLAALGGRQKVYAIPKGTTLLYPDGSVAGRLTADMNWTNPSEESAKLCTHLRVDVDSPLCVSASSAKETSR